MKIFTSSLALCSVLTVSGAAQASLLTNGDFSLGNTGFSSQYTSSSQATAEGVYVVGSDPHAVHSYAISFGDHTTGNGLMLLVNGATQPNKTVWQDEFSVTTETTYNFSGWVTTWGRYTTANLDPSPPVLQFFVNDVQVGANVLMAPENGQWNQFSLQWASGNVGVASLRIVDIK